MSDSESLNLCLINNDPRATFLIASTGQRFYSIKTPASNLPSLLPVPVDNPASIDKSQRPTTVFRLEGGASSIDQVETQVGTIHPSLEQSGLSTVDLYLEKVYQLVIESAGGRSIESIPPISEPGNGNNTNGLTSSEGWVTLTPRERNGINGTSRQFLELCGTRPEKLYLADVHKVPYSEPTVHSS